MRHLDRPSARFLGLLHGQAVLRGGSAAQSCVESAGEERGRLSAVMRHSFTYVRRRRELNEGVFDHDFDEALDPAYLVSQGAVPRLSSDLHGRS